MKPRRTRVIGIRKLLHIALADQRGDSVARGRLGHGNLGGDHADACRPAGGQMSEDLGLGWREPGRLGLPPAFRAQQHSDPRSEEHTSELQSLMRSSYAVFCLNKKHTTLTRPTVEKQSQ